MKRLKFTVIGGGSSYTPELMDGIIKNYHNLPVTDLVLVDIEEGREKVGINEALLKRMAAKAGLKINISSTLDRREALKDADFVITQFRVGGLKARSMDEAIPLKYGVIGQETTGPGGFFKALRTIPVILDICKDMEEICKDAYLINFTNPSGVITQAVLNYTNINCIGLCNVPLNMQRDIAGFLNVSDSEIYCKFIGLNHLSFIESIYHRGKDVMDEVAQSPVIQHEFVNNIPNKNWDGKFIETLHLIPSPYLKYYYFETGMLEEEQETFKQTGKTRALEVMEIEKELFALYQDENRNEKPDQLSKRGGALYSEAAISLIDSIYNDRSKIHVVNSTNHGATVDLPFDCVIEGNCMVNKLGALPLGIGRLPVQVKGLIQHAKMYETLTIEAAVESNKAKAFIALLNNPLIHDAVIAEKIFTELFEAHKDYLTQFK